MKHSSVLYNVNEILVQPGFESEYIEFEVELNNYLKQKYGKYYIELQLYQNKQISNQFYVIADYKDKCGINAIITIIEEDINRIYDDRWGDSVVRKQIFAFVDFNKVIPA